MRRISGVSLKHEKTLLSPEVRKTPFKVALGRELPAPEPPRSVRCPAAAGPILMEMRSPAVPRGGGRGRGPGGLSPRPAWLPGATSPPLRAPRPPGPGADKEEEGAALPPAPPLLAVVWGRIPAARGAPQAPALAFAPASPPWRPCGCSAPGHPARCSASRWLRGTVFAPPPFQLLALPEARAVPPRVTPGLPARKQRQLGVVRPPHGSKCWEDVGLSFHCLSARLYSVAKLSSFNETSHLCCQTVFSLSICVRITRSVLR